MNFIDRIDELGGQIAAYYKALNYHAAWFLLSTIAVWSLSDNHPIPAMVAAILIMCFYMVIIFNDLKAKYGGKLIIDGWKTNSKKAIDMLEAEVREHCGESEQQKFLNLLEEKCRNQMKFKNFLRNRSFFIAYLFWGWMFLEMLLRFFLDFPIAMYRFFTLLGILRN